MAKSKKTTKTSTSDYLQYAIEGIESVVRMLEKPRPNYITHEDERISIMCAANKINLYREFSNRMHQIANEFTPIHELAGLTTVELAYDNPESNRFETLQFVREVLSQVKAI